MTTAVTLPHDIPSVPGPTLEASSVLERDTNKTILALLVFENVWKWGIYQRLDILVYSSSHDIPEQHGICVSVYGQYVENKMRTRSRTSNKISYY